MGDKYGPMVVARKPFAVGDLPAVKIAVPGTLTRLVDERLHPDDRERVRSELERAITQAVPIDFVQRHVLPDGSVKVFRTLAEPERDAAGRVVRLRGSNQDITAQRRGVWS